MTPGRNNYCRNPSLDPKGPWCFTTDGKMDYCDVGTPALPLCADLGVNACLLSADLAEYSGTVSITATNTPCAKWSGGGTIGRDIG